MIYRYFFIAMALVFGFASAQATVAIRPAEESFTLSEKQQKKWDRKKDRLEKKLAKWEARAEEAYSILDNSTFRLGAILLLGAIGVGILSGLGLLRALLGFVAGLLAFAGVVLLVWGLIEFYG